MEFLDRIGQNIQNIRALTACKHWICHAGEAYMDLGSIAKENLLYLVKGNPMSCFS
jgi:hypothetical protein